MVEVDNVRLRPANSKHYTGDGSTVQFTIAKTASETNIVNVADYGAFLELTPGVEGLIHVSEMRGSQT